MFIKFLLNGKKYSYFLVINNFNSIYFEYHITFIKLSNLSFLLFYFMHAPNMQPAPKIAQQRPHRHTQHPTNKIQCAVMIQNEKR